MKYDGFRSLAHISNGECRLISRNGNTFTSFQSLADALGHAMRGRNAILDGELVCLADHDYWRDEKACRLLPASR